MSITRRSFTLAALALPTAALAKKRKKRMGKIVFHGDSVTYGIRYGVTAADTFATKIGAARGFASVVNTGVPNNTSADGLARFSTDVLSQSPDALCIMFGINDVYNSVPVTTYEANILSMVQQAKANGIRVTLMTPNLVRSTSPFIDNFPAYLDALTEVAAMEKVPLVDCYREFIHCYIRWPTAQFDALWAKLPSGAMDVQHPGVSGHQLITDMVLKSCNFEACA